MIDHDLLATHFGRSARLLLTNLDGIDDAQSLWQPTPDVNSINWLAGHLISTRCGIARQLGLTPVWDDATREVYKFGSDRLSGEGVGVLSVARLSTDFNAAHESIDAALRGLAAGFLSEVSISPRFATRAEHLLYLQFHEAHHAGQVMTLREQLGMPSVWPF